MMTYFRPVRSRTLVAGDRQSLSSFCSVSFLSCAVDGHLCWWLTHNCFHKRERPINTTSFVEITQESREFHAGDRTRTGTPVNGRGILSPLRLPVSPLRQSAILQKVIDIIEKTQETKSFWWPPRCWDAPSLPSGLFPRLTISRYVLSWS